MAESETTQQQETTGDQGQGAVQQMVPLELIDRSRNHRLDRAGDDERIEQLAASIATHGQLQAVRVYETHAANQPDVKKPYILGCGARRCLALETLGRTHVKAEVYGPAPDEEIEAARGIENLQRQDLTPIEEAIVVADLLRVAKTEPFLRRHPVLENPYHYVASELGRSVAWVRDRDYLDRLHPVVQDVALRTGLPAGHLRELAKVGDAHLQLRLTVRAAGGPSWSIDEDASIESAPPRLIASSSGGEQQLEHWYQALEQKAYERATLADVQQWVAQAQRSLKSAPWAHEAKVPAAAADVKKVGGTLVEQVGGELRPCAGCPHNSETDVTLFGVEPDKKNPRGVCLHPACYEAKMAASMAAKEKIRKAAGRWKKPPSNEQLDKAAEKAGDFLKVATARATARAAWQRTAAHEKAAAEQETTPAEVADHNSQTPDQPSSPPPPDPQADWLDRLEEWVQHAMLTIADVVKSLDQERRGQLTRWCMFTMIAVNDYPRLMEFDVEAECRDGRIAPLEAGEREIVDDVIAGRWARLELLLVSSKWFNPMELPIGACELWIHPEALRRLAEAWSIELPSIPQAPEVESETPQAESETTEPEKPDADGDAEAESSRWARKIQLGPSENGAAVTLLANQTGKHWLGRYKIEWPTFIEGGPLSGPVKRGDADQAIKGAADEALALLNGFIGGAAKQQAPEGDQQHAAEAIGLIERWLGAPSLDEREDAKAAAVADARGRVESQQWRQQPMDGVLRHAGASFHGLGALDKSGGTLGAFCDLLDDAGDMKQRVPGFGRKMQQKFMRAAARWLADHDVPADQLPPWIDQVSEEVAGG